MLSIFLLIASIGAVLADGAFMPPVDYTRKDLTEPCQRALLFHDGNRETLCLFVDYQGDANQFAWVIPCPSKPEVSLTTAEVWDAAVACYRDMEIAAWQRQRQQRDTASGGIRGGSLTQEDQVTIHQSQILDEYEISVLSAAGGDALLIWLNAHGFRTPNRLAPILQQYTDEGWFFVAVKVRAETGKTVTLHPIRLDFTAAQPIYPLRISTANRGITDVRLYLVSNTTPAHTLEKSSYATGFPISAEVLAKYPQLTKIIPQLEKKPFCITRLTEQLIPQVMARLDDRLAVSTQSDLNSYALIPYSCQAKTVGFAEALVADNRAEATFAIQNLYYYYSIQPRPGRLPDESLTMLHDVGKRLGQPLQQQLISYIDNYIAGNQLLQYTNGAQCEGAMILLSYLQAGADPAVITCLERAAGNQRAGNEAINSLQRLGTPESRRALFRIAQSDSSHHTGAAFRLIYSLEENEISQPERIGATGELIILLETGIAVGDAAKRGLNLLKQYSEQDYGTDWPRWRAWLAATPHDK